MIVLVVGVGLFVGALLLHGWILSRRPSRKPRPAPAWLFIAVLALALMAVASPIGRPIRAQVPDLHLALAFQLYALLSLAYCVLFDFSMRRRAAFGFLAAELERAGAAADRDHVLGAVADEMCRVRVGQLKRLKLVEDHGKGMRLTLLGRLAAGSSGKKASARSDGAIVE